MLRRLGLLLFALLAACSSDDSPGGGEGDHLVFDTVATGLTSPVFLTSAPGDSTRLFVVEQGGTIRIIRHDSLLDTPFLDFSDSVAHSDEQGMLGLAFAPDFATSGTFYVHTVATNGDIRILRFKAASAADNSVDPATKVEILRFAHPQANHNGGMIAFGNDGYLYIGSGDGGGGGDPLETGQDPSDLLGAILRIDVSGDSAGYTVPVTNPFVGDSGYAPEVWAYGLRNPWRFSFDRQTHELWIGDVGQGEWEEVDRLPAGVGGQNLGWDELEGTHCYEPSSGCSTTGKTMPLFDYAHGTDRCSVIGGYVYRGTQALLMSGMYLYGDLCDGVVRAREGGSTITTPTGGQIFSFGEDANGELYVLLGSGVILRIADLFRPIG
ncbi:MAG TPA: PQQ-dependent sugar dehydrogenase [Gemmatimonadales bacterium]|nr:PQQ-dependent sugar dehydrogenase [Gemmatimonadales bacterium]